MIGRVVAGQDNIVAFCMDSTLVWEYLFHVFIVSDHQSTFSVGVGAHPHYRVRHGSTLSSHTANTEKQSHTYEQLQNRKVEPKCIFNLLRPECIFDFSVPFGLMGT